MGFYLLKTSLIYIPKSYLPNFICRTSKGQVSVPHDTIVRRDIRMRQTGSSNISNLGGSFIFSSLLKMLRERHTFYDNGTWNKIWYFLDSPLEAFSDIFLSRFTTLNIFLMFLWRKVNIQDERKLIIHRLYQSFAIDVNKKSVTNSQNDLSKFCMQIFEIL
jgi:hypothetical protein